jgi:hypothetical protein
MASFGSLRPSEDDAQSLAATSDYETKRNGFYDKLHADHDAREDKSRAFNDPLAYLPNGGRQPCLALAPEPSSNRAAGFHRGRFTKDEPDGTTSRCAAALESPSEVGERSEISSSSRETATARRPLPAVAGFRTTHQ